MGKEKKKKHILLKPEPELRTQHGPKSEILHLFDFRGLNFILDIRSEIHLIMYIATVILETTIFEYILGHSFVDT